MGNIRTWLVGDPKSGGFRGVRLGVTNNDLQPGESSDMYNYLTDDAGLVKRQGEIIDNFISEAITATLTRPSIAYLPNGVQVASGAARYYTKLLIEEEVSNLLSANQSDVETNTAGFSSVGGGTVTISRETSEYWEGTSCLKIVTDGNAGVQGFQTNDINVAASNYYTNGIWIKGTPGGKVYLINHEATAGGTSVKQTTLLITLTSTWTRYYITNLFGSTGEKSHIQVSTPGSQPQALTFYVDGLSIIQKSYDVTWQIGGTTRNAETLTIPITGIFAKSNWCISVDFEPTSSQLATGKSGRCWIIAIDANNSWKIVVNASGNAYLEVKSNGVSVNTLNASDIVLIPGTKYRLTARGNGSIISFFINGSKTAAGDVSYVEPLGTIPENIYIGSNTIGTECANGYFSNLLFDNYLTESQILAFGDPSIPIPITDHTLAHFSFTGTLNGSKLLTTAPNGLFRYYNGSENKTFVKSGTKIFDLSVSGYSAEILTGLTAGDEVQFLAWLGKYLLTDGSKLYCGTSGTASEVSLLDHNGNAITGIKPKGKSIALYMQKLWLTRDSTFPTRVYFSEREYHERYHVNDSSNSDCWVACDRDDGKPITGFIEAGDKLLVFKRNRMYFITGDYIDWSHNTLSVINGPDVGAYDQKTIVKCPDGFVRFFGPGGVWQISATSTASNWQYTDGYGPRMISQSVNYELEQIAEINKSKCCAAFYKNYYILFYAYGEGISYNNRAVAYDVLRQCWFPIRDWKVSCVCRFEDDTIHIGQSDDANVHKIFTGTSDNGTNISSYWKSRAEGIPGVEQCLHSLRMANVHSGQTVTVGWKAESGSPANGTWNILYQSLGTKLGDKENPGGGFILGDKTNPGNGSLMISKLSAAETSNNPEKRIEGSERFKEIYFTFSETSDQVHNIDYLEVRSYPVRSV